MTGELRGVGRTALWVAKMRAVESARPDRLFDDRFATVFLDAATAGDEAPNVGALPPGASEFLAIRTRFYDDYLLGACAAGVRQVVLLASGLDSRAFRLTWPTGVRLFELDLPDLFQFKENALATDDPAAGCDRIPVPADLRGDWATPLTAAGFDPAMPTAWLAEGLLLYLTMADNDRLLAAVGALSTWNSQLAFDHMHSSAGTREAVRRTEATVRRMGVDWQSSLDDPSGWLTGHGWRQPTTARVPALGERYGRPMPDFVDLTASNATVLCTAFR